MDLVSSQAPECIPADQSICFSGGVEDKSGETIYEVWFEGTLRIDGQAAMPAYCIGNEDKAMNRSVRIITTADRKGAGIHLLHTRRNTNAEKRLDL